MLQNVIINGKGMYELTEENVNTLSKLGIPFSIPFTEDIFVKMFNLHTTENPKPAFVSIEGVVPIVSIHRVKVEDGEHLKELYGIDDDLYIDYLKVSSLDPVPIGIGYKDKETPEELVYVDRLSKFGYSFKTQKPLLVKEGSVSQEDFKAKVEAIQNTFNDLKDLVIGKDKGILTHILDYIKETKKIEFSKDEVIKEVSELYEIYSQMFNDIFKHKGDLVELVENYKKKQDEYISNSKYKEILLEVNPENLTGGLYESILKEVKNLKIAVDVMDYYKEKQKAGEIEKYIANAILIGVDKDSKLYIDYGFKTFNLNDSLSIEKDLRKYGVIDLMFSMRSLINKNPKVITSFIRNKDAQKKGNLLSFLDEKIKKADIYSPELKQLLENLRNAIESENEKSIYINLKKINSFKNSVVLDAMESLNLIIDSVLSPNGDGTYSLANKEKRFPLVKKSDLITFSNKEKNIKSYRATMSLYPVPYIDDLGQLQYKVIPVSIKLANRKIISNNATKEIFKKIYPYYKEYKKALENGNVLDDYSLAIYKEVDNFLKSMNFSGYFYPKVNDETYSKYKELINVYKEENDSSVVNLLYDKTYYSYFEREYGEKFEFKNAINSIARWITEKKFNVESYGFFDERIKVYKGEMDTPLSVAIANAITLTKEFSKNITFSNSLSLFVFRKDLVIKNKLKQEEDIENNMDVPVNVDFKADEEIDLDSIGDIFGSLVDVNENLEIEDIYRETYGNKNGNKNRMKM